MNDYWVYILRCSDGSYYTGITNDHLVRLRQHQEGIDSSCYTFKRRPLELVYLGHFNDVHEAIAWEKHVKRWSRKKKEALIRGDEQSLHELAECKNITHAKYKRVMVSGDEPYTLVAPRLRSG